MGKINVLPKHISELIAAGEVVERPSSVIKELVENSIDAGAHAVTVEIQRGGISYIRVTDDGCGMSREDVSKAFISHATSKISVGADLDSIGTLGFRGEALPSIAAVSRTEVMTRRREDAAGTRYCVEGGEEKGVFDAGCPIGTTITVRDLFYNTPARMKFLKKDVSEGNSVAGVADRLALSHPEVSVRFIREGKQVLLTPGRGDLLETIFAVFGGDFSRSLIKTEYKLGEIEIGGFVSKPANARASRGMQFFFINGRLVKSVTAMSALERAYKDSLMVGKFPSCVLHINMPTSWVDVNVHPAKIEVRFSDEKKVYEAVYYAAKSALSQNSAAQQAELVAKSRQNSAVQPPKPEEKPVQQMKLNTQPAPQKSAPAFIPQKPAPVFTPQKPQTVYAPPKKPSTSVFGDSDNSIYKAEEKSESTLLEFDAKSRKAETRPIEKEPIQEAKAEIPAPSAAKAETKAEITEEKAEKELPIFRIVGEVFRTYIIAECGKEILFIDKHAAHERMIYNRLKKEAEIHSQVLLAPVMVTLSKEEYSAVNENTEFFSRSGFAVEDFGAGTVMVRECPIDIEASQAQEIVTELAGKLAQGRGESTAAHMDWLYHSVACRAAIKAGAVTSAVETEALVRAVLADEEVRFCPHGRPVITALTQTELEKRFGRIQ